MQIETRYQVRKVSDYRTYQLARSLLKRKYIQIMQIPEIRIEPGLLPVIYPSDLKGEFILTAKTGQSLIC